MGVHTQGESGFFDEDVEVLEQNEVVEQHEPANDGAVGKWLHRLFDPFPLFIYFLIHSPVPSFRLTAAPLCYLSRKNLYGKKMDEEVRSFPRLQVH
jgi:hypothetical protein